MALEITRDLRDLSVRHLPQTACETPDARLAIEIDGQTVELPALKAGEVQRCFPQSLRGQGAGVNRCAADLFGLLDECDASAEVGGLNGALFPCRAGAHYHEIEAVDRSHESSLRTILTTRARQMRVE